MTDRHRGTPGLRTSLLVGVTLLVAGAAGVAFVPIAACPICLNDPVVRHVDSSWTSSSRRPRCLGCEGRGRLSVLRSWTAPKEIASTDTSVWWAPLVTYYDREVATESLLRLLESHGILQIYVGDRSQRMRVAFERHREAVELLKATPFAGKLRIHTITGGPRPEGQLPATTPGGPGETRWDEVGAFKNAEVDPAHVLRLLNDVGLEAGLVTYGTAPDRTTILVPASHADRARQILKSSAFAGSIGITR